MINSINTTELIHGGICAGIHVYIGGNARIDLVRVPRKEYFNWWTFPDVRHEE
jgi:O-acetyl-ADP-ribose deacetylase (regulator of RNase III)